MTETNIKVNGKAVLLEENGRTQLGKGTGLAPIIQGIAYVKDEMVIFGKLLRDTAPHLYTLASFGFRNNPQILKTLTKLYHKKS